MTELEEFSDQALVCGTRNHALDLFHDPEVPSPEYSGWRIDTLRCLRCGARRWDTVDRNSGELVRRRYFYKPGYRPKLQTGERVYVAQLRLEMYERIERYGTDEELFAAITVPRRRRAS